MSAAEIHGKVSADCCCCGWPRLVVVIVSDNGSVQAEEWKVKARSKKNGAATLQMKPFGVNAQRCCSSGGAMKGSEKGLCSKI